MKTTIYVQCVKQEPGGNALSVKFADHLTGLQEAAGCASEAINSWQNAGCPDGDEP